MPEALVADGLDEAIIGTAYRCGFGPVVAYDRQACVAIFMEQGMTWEEAEEWMSFNVEGAYVGENTPIFITDLRGLKYP